MYCTRKYIRASKHLIWSVIRCARQGLHAMPETMRHGGNIYLILVSTPYINSATVSGNGLHYTIRMHAGLGQILTSLATRSAATAPGLCETKRQPTMEPSWLTSMEKHKIVPALKHNSV